MINNLFETLQNKCWITDVGKDSASGETFDLTRDKIILDYKDGTLIFLGLYLHLRNI
jgi:hypothetical protein